MAEPVRQRRARGARRTSSTGAAPGTGPRYRLVVWIVGIVTFFWIIRLLIPGGDTSWISTITEPWEALPILTNPSMLLYAVIFPLFFIMNFVILLGPMMLMGITQMQGFEPGDAEWGVKLDDVRGQAEAKKEVRRVVSIWQSGEAFEAAGGKRERGPLFLAHRNRQDDALEGDRHRSTALPATRSSSRGRVTRHSRRPPAPRSSCSTARVWAPAEIRRFEAAPRKSSFAQAITLGHPFGFPFARP